MLKYAALMCAALALAACATPAKVSSMIGTPTVSVPANSSLIKAVQVNNISGGQSTNPLWTSKVGNPEFQEALQQSLSAQGLLGQAPARYRLDAILTELHQPLLGFDLTVTSTIRYVVTDTMTNKMPFDQTITAEYTAHVGDAFLAVERLRLANEGSIKGNISKFLDQLIQRMGTGGTPISALRFQLVAGLLQTSQFSFGP